MGEEGEGLTPKSIWNPNRRSEREMGEIQRFVSEHEASKLKWTSRGMREIENNLRQAFVIQNLRVTSDQF